MTRAFVRPLVFTQMLVSILAACGERRFEGRTEAQWRQELQSSDAHRRVSAAGALDAMDAGSQETHDALLNALADASASVQVAAAKALEGTHEARTSRAYILQILWRSASDSTSADRVSALEALGLSGYQDAHSLPILIDALRDPSAATRATAAVTLAMFGGKARIATSPLRALMDDTSEVVRHEVRDALTAITGHKSQHK